jgi:hypothetical protein
MHTTILPDPGDSSDHRAPNQNQIFQKESTVMPQKRTQIADNNSRKELAATRGRIYLDYAKKIRLASGPFYIAVRDELHDFVDNLKCPQGASGDRVLAIAS